MAENENPITPPLTCPNCRYKFPLKAAIYAPDWKRYTCPVCRTRLSPLVRHKGLTGAALGLFCYAGVNIIAWVLKPLYGYVGIAIGVLIFAIIGFYIAIIVSAKFTFLKEADDTKRA